MITNTPSRFPGEHSSKFLSFGGVRYLAPYVNDFPRETFTVCCWFNAINGGGTILHYGYDTLQNAPTAPFVIEVGENISVGLADARLNLDRVVNDGIHHIAVTWKMRTKDNVWANIFLDGINIGDKLINLRGTGVRPESTPEISKEGPLFIGLRAPQNSEEAPSQDTMFSGDLTDFSIWPRVLTPEEIKQQFKGEGTDLLQAYIALPLYDSYIDWKESKAIDLSRHKRECRFLEVYQNSPCLGTVRAFRDFPIGDRTICMWLRCDNRDSYETTLLSYADYSNSDDSHNTEPWIIKNPGMLIVANRKTNISLVDGLWHHLAIVVQEQQYRVYVDGEIKEEWTASDPKLESGHPLIIGAPANYDDSYERIYKGQLHDVRIWSMAKEQKDIQSEMGDRLLVPAPNLVSYWLLAPYDKNQHFTRYGKNNLELLTPWYRGGIQQLAKKYTMNSGIHKNSPGITSRSVIAEHYEYAGKPSPANLKSKTVYRTIISLPPSIEALSLSARAPISVTITGKIYKLKPSKWIHIHPNMLSKVMLTVSANTLSIPPIYIRNSRMQEGKHMVVFPDSEVHGRLNKLEKGALAKAKNLRKNKHLTDNHLHHTQKAVQNLSRLVKYTYNHTNHGVHHDRGIIPHGMPDIHWAIDFGYKGFLALNSISYRKLSAAQVPSEIGKATVKKLPIERASVFNIFKEDLAMVSKIVVHTVKKAENEITKDIGAVKETTQKLGEDLVHGDVRSFGKDLWNEGMNLVKGGENTLGRIIGFQEHAVVITIHSMIKTKKEVQYVLEHSGHVGLFIEHLLSKLGEGIETVGAKVLEWIGEKMHWSDILATQETLSQAHFGGLLKGRKVFEDIKNKTDNLFSSLKTEIQNYWNTSDTPTFSISPPDASEHSGSYSNHIEKGEWLFSTLVEHPSDVQMDHANDIPDKVHDLRKQLKVKVSDITGDLLNHSVPLTALRTNGTDWKDKKGIVQAVATYAEHMAEEGVDLVNALVDKLIDLGIWLFDTPLRETFQKPIHVPIISDLFKIYKKDALEDFRTVDIISFMLAVPITELSHAIHGEAPFSSNMTLATREQAEGSISRTTLDPLPNDVKGWGITYGVIHILMMPLAAIDRGKDMADKVSNFQLGKKVGFTRLTWILTFANISMGFLSQLSGSPMGVPFNKEPNTPIEAKQDIFAAPQYWAEVIWILQWFVYGFDTITGLGNLKNWKANASVIPAIEGKDIFMSVLGIMHVALMGVLDVADRRKGKFLEGLTPDDWKKIDIDLYNHIIQKAGTHQVPKLRENWTTEEKMNFVKALRNYDEWASQPHIAEKGFGNVCDTIPEIASVLYFPPLLEASGGITFVVGLGLDSFGHLGEGITYIVRTAKNRLV